MIVFEFEFDERKKEFPSRVVDRVLLVRVILPKRLDRRKEKEVDEKWEDRIGGAEGCCERIVERS